MPGFLESVGCKSLTNESNHEQIKQTNHEQICNNAWNYEQITKKKINAL